MDIEQVFKKAKKIMLKDQEHAPLILVETESKFYTLPIRAADQWNGDTYDKEKLLFKMGRKLAQAEHETAETVQTVWMVAEMWFAENRPDEPEKNLKRASQRDDRREGICVVELSTKDRTLEQKMYLSEIIRHGEIIDLAPFTTPDEQSIQSMLLPCFLAGIGSATMSSPELEAALKRFYEVGEI